jgi:hypothetical protein
MSSGFSKTGKNRTAGINPLEQRKDKGRAEKKLTGSRCFTIIRVFTSDNKRKRNPRKEPRKRGKKR